MTRAAYWSVPASRVGSRAEAVAGVAETIGRPLDAWQVEAVDALTSVDAEGRWAQLEGAIVCPRQQGKTAAIVLPIVLAEALYGPPDLIVWSAHQYNTAQKTFVDLLQLIDGCSELSRRVKKITQGTGEEQIEFTNGTILDLLARSGKTGRGFSRGKIIVVDEALFFVATQAGALLPVAAAHPNPLILYASSAAKIESDYLRSLRNRGRAGNDPSLAYVEHCAPGSLKEPGCALGAKCPHRLDDPGCSLNNVELMRVANPAVGIRNRMDLVLSFRRALESEPLEFAREFLGWHEDPDGSEKKIPPQLWAGAVDELSRVQDRSRPVFVLDVSPDRATAAIGVAGRRADGRTHVGVARHGAGDGWAVGELKTLLGKHGSVPVAVDGASPAAALLAPLEAAGVTVQKLTLSEIAQACGFLETELRRTPPGIAHRGDPLVTGALAAAAIRDVGDGAWAWARRTSEGDITPLVVVTLAGWLAASRPSYDLARSVW